MNLASGAEGLVKQNNINQIKWKLRVLQQRYVSRVQQEGLFTKLESVATKLIRDLRFGSKKAFITYKNDGRSDLWVNRFDGDSRSCWTHGVGVDGSGGGGVRAGSRRHGARRGVRGGKGPSFCPLCCEPLHLDERTCAPKPRGRFTKRRQISSKDHPGNQSWNLKQKTNNNNNNNNNNNIEI